MSAVKLAEIGGSGTVKPLSHGQVTSQKLQTASAARQGAVVGVLGSRGASDAISGFRDNDVTHNLVNGKHNNPAMMNVKSESRATKASSNVKWSQPKGRKLTLQ